MSEYVNSLLAGRKTARQLEAMLEDVDAQLELIESYPHASMKILHCDQIISGIRQSYPMLLESKKPLGFEMAMRVVMAEEIKRRAKRQFQDDCKKERSLFQRLIDFLEEVFG